MWHNVRNAVDSLSSLDLLMQFRPGNVVRRMGHAPLPVLSPRTLRRALRGSTAVLAAFPVVRPAMVPAVLRAARFEDAVVGFSLPLPLADRGAPDRLADQLLAAVDEADHTQPIFIQAGPIPVTPDDGQLEAGIFRCIEAGCTLISLDLTRAPETPPERLGQLLEPIRELDLALELVLPLSGPPPATGPLRRLLDGLGEAGALPDFLRFSPSVVQAVDGFEPDWLQLLRQVTDSYEIGLSLVEPSEQALSDVRPWVEGGVAKVSLPGPFLSRALGEAAASERDELVERALSMETSLGALLSLIEEKLPPLTEHEALRLEARAFGDAQDLFRGMRLSGTGRRVVEMLEAEARA